MKFPQTSLLFIASRLSWIPGQCLCIVRPWRKAFGPLRLAVHALVPRVPGCMIFLLGVVQCPASSSLLFAIVFDTLGTRPYRNSCCVALPGDVLYHSCWCMYHPAAMPCQFFSEYPCVAPIRKYCLYCRTKQPDVDTPVQGWLPYFWQFVAGLQCKCFSHIYIFFWG